MKQMAHIPSQVACEYKRALFLDRDGVINHDTGYASSPKEIEFIDGIFELVRDANILGYLVIIVTNQSGIGRGLFSLEVFLDLMEWMKNQFQIHDAYINAIYYCPCHPTEGHGEYLSNCNNRKPNPGMLLKAKKDFGIDMQRSLLIGDKETDIQAGNRAGVGQTILLGQSASSLKECTKVKKLSEVQKLL